MSSSLVVDCFGSLYTMLLSPVCILSCCSRPLFKLALVKCLEALQKYTCCRRVLAVTACSRRQSDCSAVTCVAVDSVATKQAHLVTGTGCFTREICSRPPSLAAFPSPCLGRMHMCHITFGSHTLTHGQVCLLCAKEEEEFYKLRPANKTDHLCQSWQYSNCHMFMKFRQSIT